MPTITRTLAALALGTATLAAPALAQMAAPDASTYMKKAGASDKFEISEANVMKDSQNPQVSQFANKMITDHTKSTDMVKQAAKADGKTPPPPMLTPEQRTKLARLSATPKGKARDALYVQQQKPAHEQALQLHKAYAANGNEPHLKSAAQQIVPVVQSHIDMLNQMPAQKSAM